MLRQKKLSFKKISEDQGLSNYLNENFRIEGQTNQLKNTHFFKPHAKVLRDNQTRQSLRQIDSNSNVDTQIINRKDRFANNKLLLGYGRNFALSQVKQQTSLFKQILMTRTGNQELSISESNTVKPKRFLALKGRSNTSLCLSNAININKSSICPGQLMFSLNKTELSMKLQDSKTISKSRALMNFSKVYRYDYKQPSKYLREKAIFINSAHLSAQRIAMQHKQKKQNNRIAKSMQRSILAVKTARQKSKVQMNKRYRVQQEQFQLAAWDIS